MRGNKNWWYYLLFSVTLMLEDCNTETGMKQTSAQFSPKIFNKGTFGHDLDFLKKHYPDVIVLTGIDSNARLIISPMHQARVMTSTAEGLEGQSFGWLNYELLASGKFLEHITPVGGEERFWMGPEGGQFSIYFKPGKTFEFANWQVPKEIDTRSFKLAGSSKIEARFEQKMSLLNYSKTTFELLVNRTIRILDSGQVKALLNIEIPGELKVIGFESENGITNSGSFAWNKTTGMLSVWILSMFNPSPQTTVVIPFKKIAAGSGKILTDDYFGKVPGERLRVTERAVFFRADGKYRSKIGISPRGALTVMGSYDAQTNTLTIVQFSLPAGKTDYVNSQWKMQDHPFSGDAVNSYNDGPLADGSQMGPFYELESSSPAAELKPGEKLLHIHRTFHFKGKEDLLDAIARKVLGTGIGEIKNAFVANQE